MAKKEAESKKVIERVYIIPLRREYQKAPRWNRTAKAVKALRNFLIKHMKSENVKIGKFLNLQLWKDGIKNPPHHVKVNVIKYEDGKVLAELFGKPIEEPKKEKEEKAKESKKKPKKEKTGVEAKEEQLEQKIEEIKEEKLEKAKEIEHEEIEELKKEHPKTHAPKPEAKQRDYNLKKKAMIPGRE
jgi:large subunit ribosomal protein L31e